MMVIIMAMTIIMVMIMITIGVRSLVGWLLYVQATCT